MWRLALLVTIVVALMLLAVSGSGRFDGPVLLQVTSDHGLHLIDLVSVSLCGIALALIATSRRA